MNIVSCIVRSCILCSRGSPLGPVGLDRPVLGALGGVLGVSVLPGLPIYSFFLPRPRSLEWLYWYIVLVVV